MAAHYVTHRVLLASASTGRLQVLRSAGFDPLVEVSGVDEAAALAALPPDTHVGAQCVELARTKALAVAHNHRGADLLVIGADSMLEFAGEAFGKPADAQHARDRWARMVGQRAILHTGQCVIDTATGETADQLSSTVVEFADLDDREIDAYVATGEPLGVAGAFTIDGLGGAFVSSVVGSPSGVVGLSLPDLRRAIRSLGHDYPSLWRPT